MSMPVITHTTVSKRNIRYSLNKNMLAFTVWLKHEIRVPNIAAKCTVAPNSWLRYAVLQTVHRKCIACLLA